jgi:molybdopterin/thiamine biosynthesis adenylyltransferase
MNGQVLLFPNEMWEIIEESDLSWGYLNLRVDEREGVITIAGVWRGNETSSPIDTTAWQRNHYLRHADVRSRRGLWFGCDPALHDLHDALSRRRDSAIDTDELRSYLKGQWVQPGALAIPIVAVSTQRHGGLGVSMWRATNSHAVPEAVSIVNGGMPPLAFIADVWPVDELIRCRTTVIGLGSIGSTLTETLSAAGVGHLDLIDYDRLEQHNLARHRLTVRDLGRFKVTAMRDHLGRLGHQTHVEPHVLNVVTGADVLRPIVSDSDIVVCAADGVTPRRVVNHIARRAGKPLVLAAVLEDGAFGEIIRVRPQTACLGCLRTKQIDAGEFNPEPGMDLGYGTGTAHRPMTAAPIDLQLVASLAAKATVSTLLEARGRWNQRLPGDYATIGLQPTPDTAPPFDLEQASAIRWDDLPDRRPDCPTCNPA